MHIPDGFLDPKVSAGLMGAAAFAFMFCLSKVREAVIQIVPEQALAAAGVGISNMKIQGGKLLSRIGEQKLVLAFMTASLVFTMQMIDFPVGSGYSGHLLGGFLASMILGPYLGVLAISFVLIIQSFFFADGGIIALGANIINMAVIGSFVSYYIYIYLKKYLPEIISILTAVWLSVVLAASAFAIEAWLSGVFDIKTVAFKMIFIHFRVGIAEAIITLVIFSLFKKIKINHNLGGASDIPSSLK